jgi:hypothetical protein
LPKHLVAFDADQLLAVTAEVNRLARSLQGRKLEEGDWTSLYCRVKGARERTWSNMPFRDYLHNGVRVEFKLLANKSPASCIGKSLMHPAATRTINFDERERASDAMAKVFAQWGAAIDDFEQRVSQTSRTASADIRWGILLWAPDHSEFLYFEEKLEKPLVKDYEAHWHDGNHRGKPTRNLHIFERASGKKRFSCTLPRNGAKLQPYFDVPDIAHGAHIFRPEKGDVLPLFVKKSDADAIQKLFPDLESENAIEQLLEFWKKNNPGAFQR